MLSLATGAYTEAQVKAALHSGGRQLSFRYELLTAAGDHKAWLGGVKAGSIAYNALAQIKRTARFSIDESVGDSINWQSDRIRPHFRLLMSDGGWATWPLGEFLLSSPTRRSDSTSTAVLRAVEAYDQLVVLVDDKVTDRYTVAAGVNYIAQVKTLLDSAGITRQNLAATTKVLPAARDWPPGTRKLDIINDLLTAINYRTLWFDERGLAVAEAYMAPSSAPIEYSYRDDDDSVTFPEVEETLDLFSVPNKWVLVVSQPDRPVLTASYTNSAASSPTSTVARGRTIVDFRDDVDAADQDALNAKVSRLAFEASQIYQSVELQTGVMPHHSDADVLDVQFGALQIAARYSEHSWEMDLRTGGRMSHRVRKVVTV